MSETTEPTVEPAVEPPAVAPDPFAAAKAAGWIAPGQIPPWAQSRIDSLTARLSSEKEAHAQVKSQLAEVQAALASARTEGSPPEPTNGGPNPGVAVGHAPAAPVDFDRAVQERAEALRVQERRIAAEEESAKRGRELYPDFDQTVKAIAQIGEVPIALVDIAMDTGAAEHVMYALGKDLNRAAEIAKMPPGKMALELAKLASPEKAPKPKVSTTPTPIAPIGTRGATVNGELRDDEDLGAWMAKREEQAKARRMRV